MFKAFDDITLPDPRYHALVKTDEAGDLWRMSLRDHHRDIERVDIPAAAPDEVRSIFTRARHVYLYAWFDYELTAVAEQLAFAALETALRLRLGSPGTLFPLTEQAVAKGFLPPKLGAVDLPFALSKIRNHWAHGSANFGTPGMALTMIGLCAEFIASLYDGHGEEPG